MVCEDGRDEDAFGTASCSRQAKGVSDRTCGSSPEPTAGVLSSSVLVLNRVYMAIHVVEVRRALVLLCRELAEVVSIEEGLFGNYDLEAWQEISEFQWAVGQELLSQERSAWNSPEVEWLRCSHSPLKVPRVIRLTRYDRVPRFTMRFSRKNLFARDAHQCQYCGETPGATRLSFDHVVPRSRGGGTSWENVVCCCFDCNARKGNKTPSEAGMSLLKPPRKPTHNPILREKLANPKYASWRSFLANSGHAKSAIA